MPLLLSKSSFKLFLKCPLQLWLNTFHPELVPPDPPELELIFKQGNEVDVLAKDLYPDGVEIADYNLKGFENTKKAIASGAKVLFQATAVADGLTARADILVKDKYGAWDIYEVKMGTTVKPIDYQDIAFQKICFTRAGIAIGKTFHVRVNNKYIRKGEIDVKKLFTSEDITDDVNDLIPEIGELILEAQDVLNWGKQLLPDQILKCPDRKGCEFVGHWLNTLEKKELEVLLGKVKPEKVTRMVENHRFDVSKLSKKFLATIPWRTPGELWPRHINQAAIREDFNQLRYPLYFFDYETIAFPIPPFEGCWPYLKLPFQFSLYVIDYVGATPKTVDFLKDRFEDPRPSIIDALREAIGPEGSVISWNAVFEKGRNEEMAKAFPKHAAFLRSINNRMYDLMLIFRKKYYVEPDFGGSASLKNVMPALISDLSYKNLNIQEGLLTSQSWPILTDPKLPEEQRHQLRKDMIDYCRLDVYGMVKILELLHKVAR